MRTGKQKKSEFRECIYGKKSEAKASRQPLSALQDLATGTEAD